MKNQCLSVEIDSIIVVRPKHGTDKTSIKLANAPTPYPNLGYACYLEIDVAAGYGEKYCREALGLIPTEIIKV